MAKTVVKFAVKTVSDDRRNCYRVANVFSDGSWTDTGIGFDNWDAAELEVERRNK